MITLKFQLVLNALMITGIIFTATASIAIPDEEDRSLIHSHTTLRRGPLADLLHKTIEMREEAKKFRDQSQQIKILMHEKDRIATETLKRVVPLLGKVIGLESSFSDSLAKAITHGASYNLSSLLEKGLQNKEAQTALELVAINAVSTFKREHSTISQEAGTPLIDELLIQLRKSLS